MLKIRKYHGCYQIVSGFLAFLITFSTLSVLPVLYKDDFAKKAIAEEDTMAPTVSISSPSDGSNAVSGETVTIIADVTDSVGVNRVEFYVDDSYVGQSVYGPYTYDWVSAVGVHSISAKAYDAAGNVGISSPVTVNVRTTVTVTSPASGSTVSGNIVDFTATSDAPLLGWAELGIDGSIVDSVYLVAPSTGITFDYVWDTTQYADGTSHEVKVTGHTAEGTVYSWGTSNVTVDNSAPAPDTSAPTVSISSPSDGSNAVSGETVIIIADATDSVGVNRVEFYVDDSYVGQSGYGPYTYDWVSDVGIHSISAKAYDAAGNVGVSSSIGVNVRTTLTVTSPASGSTVSGNIVDFTATSDAPLFGWAELGIDGSIVDSVYLAAPSTGITFDYVWDTTQYADGTSHEVKVSGHTVEGTVYSWGTSNVTVDNSMDIIPPNVTASPAGGTYNISVDVSLSADEPATIYYTLDGTEPMASSTVYSSPININSDTTLKFIAIDTSGNASGVGTENYVVDTVVPTVNASPAGEIYNIPIDVSLSANEPATIYYTLDGTEPTASSTIYSAPISISSDTILKFFGVDSAGNASGAGTEIYIIDTIVPIITASPSGGTFTAPVNITLTADESTTIYYTLDGMEPTTSSPVYNNPINVSASATLKFFGQDLAGNTSVIKTENYIIDASAPSVSIISPENSSSVSGTVAIEVYASDDLGISLVEFYIDELKVGEAPVAPYVYSWDTINITGNHTIYAKAYDTAGNIGTSGTISVTIVPPDTTPPAISASPAGGAYNLPVNVTLTADEAANIFYTTDGSEPTTGSILYTLPISINTNTTLKFLGQDATGNISQIYSENYVIDTVAPTVSITSPVGGTISGQIDIITDATDNVGVTNVEFYINEVLVAQDSVAPYVYSWDTASYGNDSYNIFAKAYDAVNNVGTSSIIGVSVNNDIVAPTVNITSPENSSSVSGSVSISVYASDDVGVTMVEYYIDGGKVGDTAVAPYVYNWDTTLYPDGSHTIQAKAYDAANNIGISSLVTVSVSNNPVPLGSWTTITTINQPVNNWARMGSYYSSYTGKTYLAGGWNSNNSRYQPAVTVYDPTTLTYSSLPDLPRGLERPFAVIRSGYLYVMGGIYNNGTTYGGSNNTVYRINLASPTTWETLGDAPRNISKSGFAVQGNIVYTYGGEYDGMLKFDISAGVWTDLNQSSPRGFGVWYPSGFATPDGLVHFYGGRNQAVNKTLYNDVVNFDPSTGQYSMTTIPAYGTPRDIAPTLVLNNKVFIVGGEINANVVTNTAETIVYDIGSGTWSTITDAPVVSKDHALGVSGSNLLMFIQGQVYSLDHSSSSDPPLTPIDLSNPVEIQITADSFNQDRSSISGQHIIWKDISNGYDQIYLYNYTTGTTTKITSSIGSKGIPLIEGNYVVYSDSTPGLEGTYLYKIDSGTTTKLFTSSGSSDIDGNKMVYLEDNQVIKLYDISTGTTSNLYSSPTQNIKYPKISGSRVIYRDKPNAPYADGQGIYQLDISTGAVSLVVPLNSLTGGPQIDLSGSYMVYSDRDIVLGGQDIFLYNFSNRTTNSIENGSPAMYYPRIDGDLITFAPLSGGNVQAYSITSGETVSLYPGIQPKADSDKIVYRSDRNTPGINDVYMTSFSPVQLPNDTTPPVIIFDNEGSTSWTNQTQDINVTLNDASGISEAKYAIHHALSTPLDTDFLPLPADNKISVAADGYWKVTVKTTDNAGNTATKLSNSYYKIDQTYPTIDSINPAPYSAVSGIQAITVTASDITTGGYDHLDWIELYEGGILSVTYTNVYADRKNSVPSTPEYNLDTSSYTNGSNITIEAVAKDIAGNVFGMTFWYTVQNDNTPPNVTASPAGGTYKTSTDVTLSVDEPAIIYYTLDGSEPTTSSSVYSAPISISSDTALKFIAIDTAGNVSAIGTETYVIDSEGPVVNIVSPLNGSSVKDIQTVQVDASDSMGIVEINLYIDDLAVSSGTTSPLIYSWDTSSYLEGAHTVTAAVYDTIYNYSTVSSTVYVDRTPPVISNVSIVTTTTKATITWTTNEPANSQVEWGKYNSWGNFTPLDTSMVTDHTVVVEGLQPGSYYNFNIRTRDRANNYASYAKTFVGTPKVAAPYVREWLINGPHENTETSVLETDYLNGEDQVLPSEHQVQGGHTWAKLVNTTDSINISGIYYIGQYAAYAHTYVYSPAPQDVLMWIGGQAGYKAWLNGSVCVDRDKTAEQGYTYEFVSVHLNEGWNRLMVKVSDLNSISKFDVRFAFDNGSGVPGLVCQLDNPADGTPPADTLAPTLSDITATPASGSATINWSTLDEAGDSKILYGMTDSYGSTYYAADRVINHSPVLTGLEADRTYHYQIVSEDAFGNQSVSQDYTFTTLTGDAPYIKSFLVNGAYYNSDPLTRLATDYIGGESQAEPCEGEGTAGGGETWTVFSSDGDYVDLAPEFGTDPNTVVYVNLYVTSGVTSNITDHQLWLGSTGAVKAWMNDTVILDKEVSRPHVFGEDRVNLVIKPGLNRLLLKLTPGNDGQFGFSVRIARADGSRWTYVGDTTNKYYQMSDPQVTKLPTGEWVEAFWASKQGTSTDKGIYVRSSYNQNKSWHPSSIIASAATEPSVTCTGDNTVLAYRKLVNNVGQVFAQVYSSGTGSWSEPMALTSGTSSVYSVQAYTDKQNNLTYVFYSYNDGSLWYRTSTDLVNWVSAQRMGRDIGPSNSYTKPEFSMIKTGEGPWALVWWEPTSVTEGLATPNSYNWPVVKFSTSNNLQQWEQPKDVTLPYSERVSYSYPDVSLLEDEAGTLFMSYTGLYTLAWYSDAYFKFSGDGGNTWSDRYNVSLTPGGGNTEKNSTSLVSDGSGQAYAFITNHDLKGIPGVPIPYRYTGPLTWEDKLGYQSYDEGYGINPASGNYTYNNTDLTIPGRGIPITIDRYYNSLDTSYVSPFGYGWNFNYNATVTTDVYGNPTVIMGNGNRNRYTRQANDSDLIYIPYPGVTGKLKKNTDGSWQLTQMDRNALNFNSAGKLVSMVDANNNTTSLTYDLEGRLTRVTDAAGRAIVFSYNTNGYIETITTDVPDFDNWTVSYSYTGDDLTGCTEPDGHNWIYQYYAGNHRLKEITDPKINPYVRLTYDEQGKVSEQLDAEGHNVALIYHQGKTDISDNTNQKTKYFDEQLNLLKIEDIDGTTELGFNLIGELANITDPKGNTTEYYYDPYGMLSKAVDAQGNTSRTKHSIYGDVVSRVDAAGTQVNNTYDEHGNLKTTNMGGSITTYNYDQYGQITSVVDAENNLTEITYDSNNYGYVEKTVTNSVYGLFEASYDPIGRMLFNKSGSGITGYNYYPNSINVRTVTDGRNNVNEFEYDNNHNLTKEINPFGKAKVYTYNSLNLLKSVTDEVYNTVYFDYDLFGRQTVETDANGNSSARQYDDYGRLLSETDYNGNTTTYSYDSAGNLKTVTDPEGGVTEMFYDELNRVYKVKDPNGSFTEITYDAVGQVKVYKNGAGNTVEYTYDDWGRTTAVKDGKGNTISYAYDPLGRVKTITYPDISYVEYEYDVIGNVQSVRDQLGRITQYNYDQYNRLEQATDPFGNIVNITYDTAGNRETVTVTTPEGKQLATVNAYDALNRQVSQTEMPGNLVTTIEYNDNHTVKAVQDPKLNRTAYTYDKVNRLKTVTNAENDTVQFEYDNEGNRIRVVDGEGKATSFVYDKANRLTAVRDAVYIINPAEHETIYTYDPNGNLKTVRNARGYITVFDYDGANRVKTATDPLGHMTSYEYDVNGFVYRITDANNDTIILDYDQMNRVTGVAFPDGTTFAYGYDAAGNLTQMVDPTGTTDYYYINGRLDTASHSGNGIELKYQYDSLGSLTAVNALKGTDTLYSNQYQYNERNLLDQLTDTNGQTYTFSYDDVGNITRINYPNNTYTSFAHDNANRVENITNAAAGGSAFLTYDYIYDHNSRRTQMTVNGTDLSAYQYDDIGQLTQVVDSRGTFTYQYDGTGNRTGMTGPGGTVNYIYDAANRLLQAGNTTYGYDNNGNRTSMTDASGTTGYTYDYNNRLTGIQTPGGSVNYTYDGLGALLSRESTVSGSVYYLNNGLNAILESDTAEFSDPTQFTLGAGGLLGQINPDTTAQYFYYDILGSLGAVSDQSGNITGTYRYDPWGVVIEQTGFETNHSYIGKYGVTDEPEAGLIHMGARFYDPAAGTFLQTDPVKGSISNPYSMVPYVYALNDPVNLIDPAGEMPSSAWFNQKRRDWANTAGNIQSFLRSKGFLGKNGKQLPVTGTYGENTYEAHWNYYLFREAIGRPYNPKGMTDNYYTRNWTDSAKEELAKWFAGKGDDVKQLQIFLRNKGYLDGKYVTGYFGAITRDALTDYMYGNKKVSQPSTAKSAGTSGQRTGGSGGLIGEFKKIPSTIASGVKGGVGAFNEAVEKQPVAASVIGILNEPADWAVTFSDWGRGDFRATDITALLPILSHGMVRSAGNALDAASIRFTQDSISATFKDGRTVDQLTNGLRSGTIAPNSVPSIRIFEQNGNLYTLDNRRLYSFQQAGVPVPYRMATLDEILNESWKFTSKNDGVSIIVRGR